MYHEYIITPNISDIKISKFLSQRQQNKIYHLLFHYYYYFAVWHVQPVQRSSQYTGEEGNNLIYGELNLKKKIKKKRE